MKFEEREKINRPSGDVFLALSRPDLYLSTWSRGVLAASAVTTTDQSTRYKVVGRDLAGKARWLYEVTLCEPGRVFAARATGGSVPFTESFTLQRLADGTTEVVHVQEIHPKGLLNLLAPLFSVVWPHLIRENLSRLKRVMEARKSRIPAAAGSSSAL